MQNLVITRDGKLDYWATNKKKIIPAIIKFGEDGHIAIGEAVERMKEIGENAAVLYRENRL